MSLANFLGKKSWHTGKLTNQAQVWEAEQKASAEASKTAELEKQIKDEREIMELRQQAANGADVKLVDTTMDWMYAGPAAKVDNAAKEEQDKQDYLLGKKMELAQEEEDAAAAAGTGGAGIGGAFLAGKTEAYVKNDNFARMHEDPMVMIRRREKESRDAIMGNPIQMARLRERLEAERRAAAGKKPKKEKKEKKLKHEYKEKNAKKEKKAKRDGGSRRSRSNSLARESGPSAAPAPAVAPPSVVRQKEHSGYGLVKKSSYAQRRGQDEDRARDTLGPNPELLHKRQAAADEDARGQQDLQLQARKRARDLTLEEKEEVRRQMSSDAQGADARRRDLATGDKNAYLEEEVAPTRGGGAFLDEMRTEAYRVEGREFMEAKGSRR